MAEHTGIAWTGATFNPWVGCQAVSSACDHCYAEALVKRWGGDFATRRRTAPANWRKPLAWNKAAAAAGIRRRVFCASLADVFDNKADPTWLADLWDLIRACPALDWQLLTKRPQNIAARLPAGWGDGWPNVWLGTTVESQTEAERRIPHLLAVPAAVHFLSCEPLLSPVDLTRVVERHGFGSVLEPQEIAGLAGNCIAVRPAVDWVIAGGESGSGAQPMAIKWARSLRAQCADADVPFFFKQTGSRHEEWGAITGKGHNPAEWPADLRVQEFPHAEGGCLTVTLAPNG